MYKVTPQHLNMSHNELKEFEENLQYFYNSVLHESKDYDKFVNNLKSTVIGCKNKSKEKKLTKIADFISSYIKINSKKSKDLTSKLLAVSFLNDDNIFDTSYMGGKVNFTYYIECLVASKYSKNDTQKLLLENELYATARSMANMRYYRTNAPDQLMR